MECRNECFRFFYPHAVVCNRWYSRLSEFAVAGRILSLAAGGRQVSRKKKKCGWANFLKLSYREFSHDVGVGRVWYDWGR